jgi:hypothetical protein
MDNKTSKFSITLDNIFRIIFFIISITGCIFQICKIWDNYFSYETNTYVIYEEEKIAWEKVFLSEKSFYIISAEENLKIDIHLSKTLKWPHIWIISRLKNNSVLFIRRKKFSTKALKLWNLLLSIALNS